MKKAEAIKVIKELFHYGQPITNLFIYRDGRFNLNYRYVNIGVTCNRMDVIVGFTLRFCVDVTRDEVELKNRNVGSVGIRLGTLKNNVLPLVEMKNRNQKELVNLLSLLEPNCKTDMFIEFLNDTEKETNGKSVVI